jgi:hypothetical protein
MMSRTIVAAFCLGWALLGCSSDDAGDQGSSTDEGSSSEASGSSATDAASSGEASGSSATDAASSGGSSGSGSGNSGGGEASQASAGGSAGAPAGEPYANVVAVTASETTGGFTFDVSVESSDVDCSQYADWWEVLSEGGELIYRRILTHSHTLENGTTDDPTGPDNTFTRDGGPVEVLADEMVIVRAHNSVSGYNGRVMRGSFVTGFGDAPDIGPDFAADVEDDEPQVESCAF